MIIVTDTGKIILGQTPALTGSRIISMTLTVADVLHSVMEYVGLIEYVHHVLLSKFKMQK